MIKRKIALTGDFLRTGINKSCEVRRENLLTIHDYDKRLFEGREVSYEDKGTLWDIVRTQDAHQIVAIMAEARETKSFGDLIDDARLWSRKWWGQGVRPGDVVGVQLPNIWDFIRAHVALARIGAVIAPIHTPYSEEEREELLSFVGAKGWLANGRQGTGLRMMNRGAQDSREFPQDPEVAVNDPLAIFFTSGSHSLKPKSCLHSHGTLLGNAQVLARHAGIGKNDRIISASPFTHLFGILALHLSFVMGIPQLLIDRFHPRKFVAACREARATVAFMVPTHIRDTLRYLQENPEDGKGLVLREVRAAGAKLPPDMVYGVEDVLHAHVVNHWGMSELGAGLTTHWSDRSEIPGRSIGRPLPGSVLAIVKEDGQPARFGETGELWFRGPSLFYGYVGNPQATEESLERDDDGRYWFKTGDLAKWGPGGVVEYSGRVKDLVVRGGMKISAIEVESAILEMPGVRQAALIAEPHERLGELGCLVMATEAGTHYRLGDVLSYLESRHMAKFKWPERLVVWESLPTTPTGKIAKAKVKNGLLKESQMTGPGQRP